MALNGKHNRNARRGQSLFTAPRRPWPFFVARRRAVGAFFMRTPKRSTPYDYPRFYYRIVLRGRPRDAGHSETPGGKLSPSKGVTLALLFAIKGGGARAFYRSAERDETVSAAVGRARASMASLPGPPGLYEIGALSRYAQGRAGNRRTGSLTHTVTSVRCYDTQLQLCPAFPRSWAWYRACSAHGRPSCRHNDVTCIASS
jgi:hypothetical protein